MDDDILMQNNKTNNINMGATSNTNSARLAALQERKKAIEEILSQKDKELRELCIQEADLTGIIPSEMPLQPGESPPSIRRKIGTSYMLPENLLKAISNKDESVADLELQLQLHANLAEAALGLAHKQNLSKTVRRQHKSEYQHHKREYKALQEKITILKEAQLIQQQNQLQHQSVLSEKHKKKPRPPEQDDGISIKSNDPFRKSDHRQSLRSLRHTLQTDNISELYPHLQQRMINNNNSSEVPYEVTQMRYDDLSSSFYKLNFSEYKSYLERQENHTSMYNQLQPNCQQYIHNNTAYHHSSVQFNQNYSTLQQQSSPHSQHSPRSFIQQQSSQNSDMSISNLSFGPKYNNSNPRYYQTMVDLPYQGHHARYGNAVSAPMCSRQSSPNLSAGANKFQYSPVPSHSSQHSLVYNPHQLQPHQQYEHNAGLGGCWKKKENGEIIWLNSSNSGDSSWHRDKRFGSLDRRKNRRIQKRISPNTDNKCATIASASYTIETNPKTVMHSPQVQTRQSQDRQLVRTQSLGSVGVQTIDGVWPSDDNSSCDSEQRGSNKASTNTIRRQKQKEWRETSLDGPESPISYVGRCHSTISAPILTPEEKYIPSPVPSSGKPSPVVITAAKSPLEIPAESNPLPRSIPDANLELFNNNNMPKNCTLVQAGHCKPYHEETKPFEMSDFYKYSTKFKKSPSKSGAGPAYGSSEEKSDWGSVERPKFSTNLNETFESGAHRRNLQVMECATAQGTLNMGLNDNLSNDLMEKQQCFNQENWYGCSQTSQKENNNATLV